MAARLSSRACAVGFGTDLIGELEDEQLNGLRLQAEAMGLVPVLVSATRTNAEVLGRDDIGRIDVGATADPLLHGDLREDA